MENLVLFALNIVLSSLSGILMYVIWRLINMRKNSLPDIQTAYDTLKVLMGIYFCPFILLILNFRRTKWAWHYGFLRTFTPGIVKLASLLSVVWITGAIVTLLYYLANVLKYRIINRHLMESNLHVRELAKEAAGRLGIRKRVRVYEGYTILSPELGGCLCPVIRLPAADYQDEELLQIFTHELIHFQHRDVLMRELMMVVACVYWINPVCKRMLAQMDIWSELYCDEAVCDCDYIDRNSYIKTLYSMFEKAERKKSWITPGLYEDVCDLERRIRIMKKNEGKKRRSKAVILLCTLLFGVMGGGTALAAGEGVLRVYGEAALASTRENTDSPETDGAQEMEEYMVVPDAEMLQLTGEAESDIMPLDLGGIELTLKNDIATSPNFNVDVGDKVVVSVGVKPSDVEIKVGIM